LRESGSVTLIFASGRGFAGAPEPPYSGQP
jgi:hypothetical protein